jgi:hypothetical protein
MSVSRSPTGLGPESIVIATHDPVLAPSAARSLVFEYGAVKVIQSRIGTEEAVLLAVDIEREGECDLSCDPALSWDSNTRT